VCCAWRAGEAPHREDLNAFSRFVASFILVSALVCAILHRDTPTAQLTRRLKRRLTRPASARARLRARRPTQPASPSRHNHLGADSS